MDNNCGSASSGARAPLGSSLPDVGASSPLELSFYFGRASDAISWHLLFSSAHQIWHSGSRHNLNLAPPGLVRLKELVAVWIVEVALKRPYTFIVLALLILMVSPLVILRTPTEFSPTSTFRWSRRFGITTG